MYTEISTEIDEMDLSSISQERKILLQQLVDYIQQKKDANQPVQLNFICTHNSRRSHLSQVWAQTLSNYYNTPNVTCYSGGTEATAMFPSAAQALEASGFKISKLSEESNPVYAIRFDTDAHPVIGFSKTFDHPFNPSGAFAAIMTCSSADKGCPFIPGTEKRIPLTFEDPKAFDGTPIQAKKYLERSLQIATELKFVFSNIN